MIPFERQRLILEELQKAPVYIEEMAKVLSVSEITVRRDLKTLEEQGYIEMKHGGMAKIIDTTKETTMKKRSIRFIKEKKAIALKACEIIEDDDYIFIDSGTTTHFMIEKLKGRRVTVVTNGLNNIETANTNNVKVISIGGELKEETMAFIGPMSLMNLDSLHFDKCFLGANGLDTKGGITNADMNESIIKGSALTRSNQSFILADASKFNKVAYHKFVDFSQVSIITDKVPEEFLDFDNILSAECKN